MNFNGVNFNEEWAKTKMEAQFVAHESHHGLSKEQLKEAYALMVSPQKAIQTAKPEDKGEGK